MKIELMSAFGKPPKAIDCKLYYPSNTKHLNQLFAGLCDLDRIGWIKLSQKFKLPSVPDNNTPQHLKRARLEHAIVEFAGKRLYFDFHDSQEIDLAGLAESDLYFKRSLSLGSAADHALSRVFPAGLNYNVESASFDRFAFWRNLKLNSGLGRFREFWRHLPIGRKTSLSSQRFETGFQDIAPKVLFMTRLWDPDDNLNRTAEKRAHFMHINEIRAQCVRRLKDCLGADFFGGVADTPVARKICPDLLINSQDDVLKWRYIQLVKRHPICITTTGLHGSIGWKLAEYVAMGRAIITERLENAVPGGFSENIHYLSFETADECAALAEKLIKDVTLRTSLMKSCLQYYQEHLRPDRMVWNMLARAL